MNVVTKRFMNKDIDYSSFATIPYLVYNVIVSQPMKGFFTEIIIISSSFIKAKYAKSEIQRIVKIKKKECLERS